MAAFNGLGLHLGKLSRLSDAKTRSISPENFTGALGMGGMATEGTRQSATRSLGQGWKVSPSIDIARGANALLADIEGPGALPHTWATIAGGRWRLLILRMFWDDQAVPSVECPVGDFFANGWERYVPVNSLAVCVNPGRPFNCYWGMPFRKRCKITLTNMNEVATRIFYQIDYTLTELPEDAAYFHASFRRSNRLPYKSDHTIIDGVQGKDHYVGTYMAWASTTPAGGAKARSSSSSTTTGSSRPSVAPAPRTISAARTTSTSACASPTSRTPTASSRPAYAGLCQVIRPNGVYKSQQRFGMYRWHITDPVRFEHGLRVTIQALGWRTDRERRYLPLQDDIASVAFWYQALSTSPLRPLPDRDYLEVI